MIGHLSGKLLDAEDDLILLDVGGVGYEVAVTTTTRATLPATGQALSLYIHQVVREDALTLYGFPERIERDVFRNLLRANGVGPKLALAILSTLSIGELADAVQQQTAARLTAVAGVGKKTAERLLLELKGKLSGFEALVVSEIPAPATAANDDAIGALLALGYRRAEAQQMLEQAGAGAALSVEEQVRLALKAQVR